MCKYDNYAIEIVHLNGNKQIREAVDSFDYNSTISLYHDIKEEYIARDVVINFIGLNGDERGLIFSKRNTIIDGERKNIKNLMQTILEAAEQLQDQYKIINDKEDYYNKKKSNIDHLFVEAIDIDELTDEDKVGIFNDIREANLMRRDYKILNTVRRNTYGDVNRIIENAERMMSEYDKHIKANSSKLKSLINRDSHSIGVHLMKELEYRDFDHRLQLMKENEKKYDRIIHLPETKTLACYNKCG